MAFRYKITKFIMYSAIFADIRHNSLQWSKNAEYTASRTKVSRSAFTLAEVLITLGIIGIVVALTMPALIANYQKMVLKNQFKHAYSLVSQAIRQVEANNGYPLGCYVWPEFRGGNSCLEYEIWRERYTYSEVVAYICSVPEIATKSKVEITSILIVLI